MCENLPHEMVPITEFSAFSSWTICIADVMNIQPLLLFYSFRAGIEFAYKKKTSLSMWRDGRQPLKQAVYDLQYT